MRKVNNLGELLNWWTDDSEEAFKWIKGNMETAFLWMLGAIYGMEGAERKYEQITKAPNRGECYRAELDKIYSVMAAIVRASSNGNISI